MSRPDDGRKRTWRFKIDDSTILEVSTPRRATERQIRRRGRWSLILGTLFATATFVAVAYADNTVADGDGVAPVAENDMSLGDVNCGVPTDDTALIAIKRNGSYSPGTNVFKKGTTATISVLSVSGAGLSAVMGAPTTISIPSDWDTASNNTPTSAVSSTVTVNSSTPGPGSGTVTYRATGVNPNNVALTRDDSFTVTWNVVNCAPPNSAPIVAADNSTVTVDEGGLASNTGTWSDANAGDNVSLSASIGTISKAGTNAAGTWSWSFQTTDGPDESQTVTITADDAHTTTSTTFSLVVNNVAPTVAFTGGPTSVDESSSAVTYSYSIDDPGADTVQSVTVSCGSLGTASNETNTNTSGTFDCTFLDGLNPATTSDVTIQATDSDGLAGNTALTTVTVSNANPVVSALTLGGNSGTACIGGNTATLDFGFSDAGVNDNPWAVDINWGDGSHTTYNASSQGTQTQRSHAYAAGSYTVSVSVTDKDGGTDSSSSAAGAVSFLYNVSGVLQPVNDTQAHNDPSVFKYGSTIPVKIKVTDCNNIVVSGLSPQIAVKKISGSTPPSGFDETISSTSGADTGTTMRYSDGIYIYNLATKSLADATATYEIRITGPFSTVIAQFGTRAK